MTTALRLLAWVLLAMAIVAYLCCAVSATDPRDTTVLAWLVYASLVLFCAIMLLIVTDISSKASTRSQALYTPLVVITAAPLIAAIPFFFADTASNGIARSIFEAFSAFTTSGGSAIGRPSLLPDALIIWRVLLEWLAGWLSICFAICVQPVLNIAGMRYGVNVLPRLETRSFYHRVVATALILGRLYLAMTALSLLALLVVGVPFPTATSLAMAGMATGGYLPVEQRLEGIGALPKIVFALVLVLACFNFTLHYAALRGRIGQVFRFVEVRGLMRMLALGIMAIFAVSALSGDAFATNFSAIDTAFLAISAISTSGISPLGTQTASLSVGLLLISLCVVGGMAGSSTGGVKILRALLIDRFVNAELGRLGSPHSVNAVEYSGRIVKVSDMLGIWSLVLVVAATIAFGSLILSALQMPFLSAIVMAVSSVANAGPMPEIIDPRFAGYGAMSPAMLSTCSVLMVLGKLEFLLALALIFSRLSRR